MARFEILTFAALSLLLFFLLCRIRLALLSPLSKIPNAHPLAPWTGLWMLGLRYKEEVNKTMLAAHARLGPIIRLGPNELSINCVDDGVKTVYGNKQYRKHPFYLAFANFGAFPMFATVDPAHHAIKRKRVTNIYSKSYLQKSVDLQAILAEVICERLIPRLQESTQMHTGEDIMKILQASILDSTTGYMWGLGNGTRYLLDRESHLEFHEMYLTSRPPSMFFAQVEMPTITRILAKFNVPSIDEEAFYFNDTTDAWCLKMCDGAEETIAEGDELAPGYNPVVYRQLKEAVAKENLSPMPNLTAYRTSPLKFQRHRRTTIDTERIITKPRSAQQIDIAAELLDEIVATNDVLGNTMSYICWELSRNPDVQEKLREEVLQIMPANADHTLPNPKDLDQLPLLHAVIMESMRRWPTNPGLEPRITPPDATLAGYTGLPAGVRVSASPLCLHNNPEVYPEPEAWRPERWMPKVEDRRRWAGNGQAERWFFGFSAGLRMCIGNHLSMHLMKYIVAAMYARFKTSVVDDSGMDVQKDGFIAAMDADQLILKVERAE